MVEHAHRKDGVEFGGSIGEVLYSQRQHEVWQFPPEVPAGEPLHDVHPGRIYADHQICAGRQHSPSVVAITAADIDNPRSCQVDVWGYARPLPVRPPLRVNVDATDLQRPLAPGMQRHQR